MRKIALAGIIALFLAPIAAQAWESNPEYESLTEAEQREFEGPRALFRDYFLTTLLYSKPSEWQYQWLESPRALELDFGSLNTRRFLIDHRLKIEVPVSPHFEVRFRLFEESDLERQSAHQVLSLRFWPLSTVGLELYGEPSFRKPNDDTGIALLWKPQDRKELRLYKTYVDVTRLKYPDTADRFVEPDLPHVYGLVARAWSAPDADGHGDFLELAGRYETPTQWIFELDQYLYEYWKAALSAFGRLQISPERSVSLRARFDRKRERRQATGATTAQLGDWYTNRLDLTGETTWHRFGPSESWELSAGASYISRTWRTELGSAAYRELIPQLRLVLPTWQRGAGTDLFQIAYLADWHRESGPDELGIRAVEDARIEQGLSLKYLFSLGPHGRLVLLASANLDEFFGRRSWGGGSGQLQLFF